MRRRLLILLALAVPPACSEPGPGHPAVPAGPQPPPGPAPDGMVWVPGGEFTMGSDAEFAWEPERPPHRVRVAGFWMDATEVTNAAFLAFVEATGHRTVAERRLGREELLELGVPEHRVTEEMLAPGAFVFDAQGEVVVAERVEDFDVAQVWAWVPGASWRHPEGPGSSIEGRLDHPVVHVCFEDAVAYCEWAGKSLPTEAQWEFASRGGLDGATYSWGEAGVCDPEPRANVWQGTYPTENLLTDGYLRTAPVASYPPNGYGLYDTGGNVWEWTADWFRADQNARRAARAQRNGGFVVEPVGPDEPWNPNSPGARERVTKGGSYLCDTEHCFNYRPSSRNPSEVRTPLGHVGFRCVLVPR